MIGVLRRVLRAMAGEPVIQPHGLVWLEDEVPRSGKDLSHIYAPVPNDRPGPPTDFDG